VDRGVVVPELGRTSVEEIEVAEPGPQDVVVRIEASGVCHSDLHVLETGWAHPLPVVLGHEGAGVVELSGMFAPGALGDHREGIRVIARRERWIEAKQGLSTAH